MGEVYRARDTRLGRTVAIKILPAQFSSDAARRQRFEREAKTISQLSLDPGQSIPSRVLETSSRDPRSHGRKYIRG